MKAKLNFLSGPALKGAALAHGEKVAFAVAAVVFAMFVYKAAKREVLREDKEPPKLMAAAQSAETHVSGSNWDTNSLIPPDYSGLSIWKPQDAGQWKLITAFKPELFPSKGKRDEPKLIAAEELKTTSGYGLFALADAGAKGGGGGEQAAANRRGVAGQRGIKAPPNSKVEGRYWTVVTGLIPVKKQLGEHQRAFERAKAADPEKDVPSYVGYKIERAEVVSGQPGEWKPLSRKDPFVEQWAVDAPEVVAKEFIDPMFAMNLGPMLGKDWPVAVAHHPQIPMMGAEVPAEAAPAEAAAKPDEPAFDEFGGAVRPKTKKPGFDENQVAAAVAADKKLEKAVDYKLLRFFDFNVVPGKQYCYRVQLGLENPNYGVEGKYLKNPDAATAKILPSPVSAPSDIVTIPRAEQIMASTPPAKPLILGEPTAAIMLTTFDLQGGVEASTTENVMRGSVTNYVKTVEIVDHASGRVRPQDGVKFLANAIVLDIRGGRILPGKDRVREPSEVLLFDNDGNIITGGNALLARNEVVDEVAVAANELPIPGPTSAGDGINGDPNDPNPPAPPGDVPDIFGNKAKPAKPIRKPK